MFFIPFLFDYDYCFTLNYGESFNVMPPRGEPYVSVAFSTSPTRIFGMLC
jgi:hypothetical protein